MTLGCIKLTVCLDERAPNPPGSRPEPAGSPAQVAGRRRRSPVADASDVHRRGRVVAPRAARAPRVRL